MLLAAMAKTLNYCVENKALVWRSGRPVIQRFGTAMLVLRHTVALLILVYIVCTVLLCFNPTLLLGHEKV